MGPARYLTEADHSKEYRKVHDVEQSEKSEKSEQSAPSARFDRLERLTDLVFVLLDTQVPLTIEAIASRVPGYPASSVARRQAFERDKRVLRDEGIPLSTYKIPSSEQYGYKIDPKEFYLPDLGLDEDEQAALHLAISAVDFGNSSSQDALMKLGASGIGSPVATASLAESPALCELFNAVRARSKINFFYSGKVRSVGPGALLFRYGYWYLVAWDFDKSSTRTFRVDRVCEPITIGRPKSGIPPDSFDVSKATPNAPWHPLSGQDAEVLLCVDAVEGPRVVQQVGVDAVQERLANGSVTLRVGVASLASLRSWVLGCLDHAVVISPLEVRNEMIAWLESIVNADRDLHSGNRDEDSSVSCGDAGSTLRKKIGHTGRKVSGKTISKTGRTASGKVRGSSVENTVPSGRGSRLIKRKDPIVRLRRLLAIVAWLGEVEAASIADISEKFSITPSELIDELELAACCGLPPYSPDSLLEIEVDEKSVRAFLPKRLSLPRTITASEGFYLAASIHTILAVPGADETGALARALAKLESALGAREALAIEIESPTYLLDVKKALNEGKQIEIEYHSVSNDEITRRVLDPLSVSMLDGRWYLDAYCHHAMGLRRFRVDRIREIIHLDQNIVESDLSPKELLTSFIPAPGMLTVRLVLDSVGEKMIETVREIENHGYNIDGKLEVSIPVGGISWLERLLLQLGTHAQVIAPLELLEVARLAANRILERYKGLPDKE